MIVPAPSWHNVRDRDSAFLPVGEFNRIALLHFSLAHYGDVEPGAFALKETVHHVTAVKSNTKFVARHSRLRHHELG
jgi:hypothetical protein